MNQKEVSQHLAESALSVVLSKWGANESIAERNALRKRLSELEYMYPHLFLTDSNIGDGETGAFDIIPNAYSMDADQREGRARVLYMGKTDGGEYRWKWIDSRDAVKYQDEYDTDDERIFTVPEHQMAFWSAMPSFCSITCQFTGDHCWLCNGVFSEPVNWDEVDELDELDCKV